MKMVENGWPRRLMTLLASLVLGGAAIADVPLPVGYTELAYIRSTVDGKQCVNTGYRFLGTERIAIRFSLAAAQPLAYHCPFGCRIANGGQFYLRTQNGASPDVPRYQKGGNAEAVVGTQPFPRDRIVDFVCRGNASSWRWMEGEVEQTDALTLPGADSPASGIGAIGLFTENGVSDLNAAETAFSPDTGLYTAMSLYAFQVFDREDQLLVDLIPCRNLEGVAGLWDRVAGRFLGNAGTGTFLGPDDDALDGVFLGWIKSGPKTFIDTGYVLDINDRLEFRLKYEGLASQPNKYPCLFGCMVAAGRYEMRIVNGDNNTPFFRVASTYNFAANAFPEQVETTLVVEGNEARWETVDGVTGFVSAPGTLSAGATTMGLFTFNGATSVGAVAPDQNMFSTVTLYSLSVTRVHAETPACQFLPYRKTDGAVGLMNVVDGTFHGNTGAGVSGNFAGGGCEYLRSTDGATIGLHKGTFAPENIAGYAAVEKTGGYPVNAAAVTNFPSLRLSGGSISFEDRAAREAKVVGPLALGGGRLVLDVTEDGADSFTVGALAIDSAVTEAEPILVEVNDVDGIAKLGAGDERSFITGEGLGLTEADARKFKVIGLIAQVKAVNGNLVLTKKDAEDVEWSGAALTDANWSTGANWKNGASPEAGAGVLFNTVQGGDIAFDMPNLIVRDLVFGSEAGVTVQRGTGVLSVQRAVTNLSAAVQTLHMPLTLGVPGNSFIFSTIGDLAITNVEKTVPAVELVKEGEGTLALDDDAVSKAESVRVGEGRLYLARTLAATPEATLPGDIWVEAGASIAFRNETLELANSDALHGKTLHLAGDGGDGRGAIYSMLTNWWGGGLRLGRIVLEADAKIGSGCITVCSDAASKIQQASVEGPYALTAAVPISQNVAVAFHQTAFALDRLVLAGGRMGFYGEVTGTITNGLHFAASDAIVYFSIPVFPETIGITVEPNVTNARLWAVASSTLDGRIDVAPGAVAVVRNDGNNSLTCAGDVVLKGTLRKDPINAGMLYLNGTLSGDGALEGTNVRFGEKAVWRLRLGDTTREMVDFSGVEDDGFLTSVRHVEVVYTGSVTPKTVVLGPARALTTLAAGQIELTVVNAQDEAVPNCWLGVADGNLELHLGGDHGSVPFVRSAVWLGGADSAADDSANWLCSNDVALVEGALPMSATTVYLPRGCAFNCLSPFLCKEVRLPETLGGSCDLTGLTAVYTGRVDLCGHSLRMAEFTGNVTITDTAAGYQKLDYIESTAGGYQCINTGYAVAVGDEISMRFNLAASQKLQWHCPFGSKDVNAGWMYFRTANGPDNLPRYQWGGTYAMGTSAFPRATPIQLVAQGRTVSWRWIDAEGEHVDGLTLTGTFDPRTGAAPLALFTENGSSAVNGFARDDGVHAAMKLYACTIKSANGTLQRDFVPARRLSDNAIGLFDRVHGIFYTNAGAGTFLAGPMRPTEGAGEFHIVVPQGHSFNDRSLALEGTVKLVKEGAGTYVADRGAQAYSGGTDVAEGTFLCVTSGANGRYGMGGEVTVREGATLDFDGWGNQHEVTFILDGGTIRSTQSRGQAASPFIQNMILTADSRLEGVDFGFVGLNWGAATLEMNGHDLVVDATGRIFFGNLTVTGGGRIVGKTGGTFRLGGNNDEAGGRYVHAPTTALDIRETMTLTVMSDDVVFRDYASTYQNNWDSGTNTLHVAGVFAPGSAQWHSTTLANGATIDLSRQTGPWAVQCSFPGNQATGSLMMADGATIFLEFGDRKLRQDEPIIAWNETTKPVNLDSLIFQPSPDFKAKGRFVVREDGVYFESGLFIFIR